MKINLRDYQDLGYKLLAMKIAEGFSKIIYWLQTGGGKGLAMSDLANEHLKEWKCTLVIMRRRELIKQTVKNFKKYHDIDCSVIMAGSKGFDPSKEVQVSSIDTLVNRIKKEGYAFLQDFDVIQIDEMQDTTSPKYKTVCEWLQERGPKKLFVGFTATPFAVGNKVHDFWETYVKPIEAHELRDRGYLAPVKMFRPCPIDTSGLKITAGDFDNVELFDRVSKLSVIGDIVDNYIDNGEGKPFIFFAVNVKHSIIMAEAFRQKGIPCIHIDASHSSEERDDAINGVKSGKYQGISNVNIFSTGVDIPCAEVLISGRPSMSEILVCQQWGRVLRPFKICGKCDTAFGGEKNCPVCNSSKYKYEKKFATIYDHAGNERRHGYPYDVREAELTKEARKKKKKDKKEQPISTIDCEKCFYLMEKTDPACPNCGWVRKIEDALNEEDGELKEISEKERDDEFVIKINKFIKQLRWKIDNGYSYGTIGDKYFSGKVFAKYRMHSVRLVARLNLTDGEKNELTRAQRIRLIQSASNLIKSSPLRTV